MYDETAERIKAFNEGFVAGAKEEHRKFIYAMRVISAKIEELEDKHWEECRQIALYDDELKKAMNLLKEVSNIHAAALRENSYETRMLSGKLMQQVRALETEVRLSEVQK